MGLFANKDSPKGEATANSHDGLKEEDAQLVILCCELTNSVIVKLDASIVAGLFHFATCVEAIVDCHLILAALQAGSAIGTRDLGQTLLQLK